MTPKIYTIDEHRLPHERIDEHASYVIQKLRLSGHVAYLVGGSVRDLLLNERPKDFDISTSATPEEVKQVFQRSCILIGRRFRLAHVRFGRKIIEVSTFRAEESEGEELVTRNNIWGNEEEDVIRRDFTINGLFYDPERQVVIDYVDGFGDLEKKILRTIGEPHLRFRQDPVRMIRLLKFVARFGFNIEEETLKALVSRREEITKSSPARILEELLRMLESGQSKNFFTLLFTHRLMDLLLPKLSEFFSLGGTANIYPLLDKIDDLVGKRDIPKPARPLLLAALLFPILEHRIEGQDLHLGEITLIAKEMIEDIFSPFFSLAKKTAATLTMILASQLRFTPPKDKRGKMRIPQDENFPLALDFLKIRASLHPDLLPIHSRWHEALYRSHEVTKPPFPRPRRRRRRPHDS